jgi:hypothetical protein
MRTTEGCGCLSLTDDPCLSVLYFREVLTCGRPGRSLVHRRNEPRQSSNCDRPPNGGGPAAGGQGEVLFLCGSLRVSKTGEGFGFCCWKLEPRIAIFI